MVGTETILVTGGAGFIGSHTCVELLAQGYRVVALDSLINSHPEAIARIRRIAGGELAFVRGDACSLETLEQLFDAHRIDGVIHFAAHKAVGDSVRTPLAYYRNNLISLLNLLEVMRTRQVKTLVFSSSATVYGDPATVPLDETAPLSATNPYAQTKLAGERILADLAASDPAWRIATLRYFNPVGAHESGLIGEDPSGIPNNLMPFVARVASGRLPLLRVFGRDWPTPDGTGVRDYVHVVDLARGHIAALAALKRGQGGFTVNLGTGRGYSVLEVIAAFERASGRQVPYEFTERRSGDVAVYYAATGLARALLGWEASLDLDRMCQDAWRWQSRNPAGYRSA
ncbi:UDP-glucose 4-epimerase GalE [Achromobacter sp. 413638]|jgi:UDP-glucose 4-epimerase|uniref:UDP-glucose 4-epimerase GalE n=1 Tax=Achromobacter sp. 413638 TaxID=3342385 RepID=UPI00324C1E30